MTMVPVACATYIKSTAPALWYRFNELTGLTAINSGSLGATYNGTYILGAGALAQVGKLGGADAVLFDKLDTRLAIPAGAYANYPAMTIAVLSKNTSGGEGNLGTFWYWSATGTARLTAADASQIVMRRAAATYAETVVSAGLNMTGWQWKFYTYDHAGDLKIDIFKSSGGAAVECTYSTQTAAVGALTDLSATALYIGNNDAQGRTLDGWLDEFALWNRVLTQAEMNKIVSLTP
ncbi:MAG TPA: hypothetical protein VJ325_02145 [Thiobacillus sp.]|nr:hypothetical protein [Thiobacillus sp.]